VEWQDLQGELRLFSFGGKSKRGGDPQFDRISHFVSKKEEAGGIFVSDEGLSSRLVTVFGSTLPPALLGTILQGF